jgi:hypothetical protein
MFITLVQIRTEEREFIKGKINGDCESRTATSLAIFSFQVKEALIQKEMI